MSTENLEAESELSSANFVNRCVNEGVGPSVVNSVLNFMEEIIQGLQQHAKESVIKHVFGDERETEMYLDELENSFTILNSEYKQSKFSGRFETVEPAECDKQNKETGTYYQTVVQD